MKRIILEITYGPNQDMETPSGEQVATQIQDDLVDVGFTEVQVKCLQEEESE